MGYWGREKITTDTSVVIFLLGNKSNKEYICHLKNNLKNTCVPASQMKTIFLYSFFSNSWSSPKKLK